MMRGRRRIPEPPLVSTLTLTQGNVTVNGASTFVEIDANINLPNGGTLTKLGAGVLQLDQTVNGNVMVQNGFLGLFGNVNGNVTAQQGGVFGFFKVSGNLINNAILVGGGTGTSTTSFSPGGDVSHVTTGNITVGGNFTQGKGGTLLIPLASGTTFGKIAVNGTATLAGTVSAVYVNGFQPKTGQTFTILTANGGLKGTTFDTVNAANGPDVFATYNKNSVVLTVGEGGAVGGFLNQPGLSLNGNQQGIANNLIAVANDPRYANAYKFIYAQGAKNFGNTLNSISPRCHHQQPQCGGGGRDGPLDQRPGSPGSRPRGFLGIRRHQHESYSG